MRALVAGCLVALSLCAAACSKAGPDKLDPEGLDAVGLAVEDQLNEPASAILDLIRASAQQAQVGWDTLFINLDGTPEPVNWWLMKRGFLELSGAQFIARAAFTMTKPAQDLIATPDQPWFAVEVTGEPEVDCKTPAALAATGCEVAVEVTPSLTDAGRAAVGTAILAPFKVSAVVALGPEDWEVTNLTTEGPPPADVALNAILGPEEARQTQQTASNESLKGRLRALAGETDAPINLEAWTPPNYVEPPAPVAPAATPSPSSRPDSPFRPGL